MNLDDKPGDASFRMLNCSMHSSGALLLDERDHWGVEGPGNGAPTEMEDINMSPVPMTAFGADNDDDDDDIGDFGFGDDAVGDDADDQVEDNDTEHDANANVQLQAARGTRPKAPPVTHDPWLMLDPHAEHDSLIRPFRAGKANKAPKPTDAKSVTPASAMVFLRHAVDCTFCTIGVIFCTGG